MELTEIERRRFWRRVKKFDGCWLWAGDLKPHHISDHGTLLVGGSYIGVHRVSYWLHKGAVPPRYVVMHTCDVPACVNPDHLTVGTMALNNWDHRRKGRAGMWARYRAGGPYPYQPIGGERLWARK